jgi:hypothetical protein
MFKFIEKWFEYKEFRKLKGACFGNEEKAERLIIYEKSKMIWLTRREAIKYALIRLEKDRGRK